MQGHLQLLESQSFDHLAHRLESSSRYEQFQNFGPCT